MCTLEKSQLYIDYTTLSSGIAFSKVAPNSLSSPNSTRAIHKEASDVGFYEGGFNLVGTGNYPLFVYLLFRFTLIDEIMRSILEGHLHITIKSGVFLV